MIGSRRELTERQRAVLDLVAERIARTGTAPSVQEIADATGTQFAVAYLALDSLVRGRYVRRLPDVPSGLVILRRS